MHRVAVDAGEEPPLAPLGLPGVRREPAAHRRALGLEPRERRLDVPECEAERRGESGHSHRAEPLQSVADDLDQRVLPRPRFAVLRRRLDHRDERCAREERLELGQPLGGNPDPGSEPRCAPRLRELVGVRPPFRFQLAVRKECQRRDRVVRVRQCSAPRATPPRAPGGSPRRRAGRDRLRSRGRASGAPSPPACGAPRAARRRGRRTAVPSRISAASGDGSVQLARDDPDPAALEPGEDALEPPRCPSPRAGSRRSSARRAGGPGSRCPRRRGSRRRRPGRGRSRPAGPRPPCAAVAAARFRPPRKRRSASATVAFQRQRAANIGASSSAWTSSVAHRLRAADTATTSSSGKLWLVDEREDDRVLGRRRLQLEVELAAEALAEREAPGAVDAAAERRVEDELHAARFVEEALEHDRLERGQRAERRARCGEIVDDLLRRALVEPGFLRPAGRSPPHDPAPPRSARPQPRHRLRQLLAPRRRLAEPERDVGGAPCASSTRTVPRSTRRIRHEVLPSWKTSPARLSIAKSSFTVPTICPCGSSTTS